MLTLTVQHPNMMTVKFKSRKITFFRLTMFLMILLSTELGAQNAEAYNQIYTKTYLDISQKDFPRALKIADSLYNTSETPRYKAKSLMLSASLLQQSGEIKDAVGYALKAEQILTDTDEYVWKAKISGFLATQYRHLKLFDQSKKYIDITTETISKIDDQRLVNQTMGFLLQEKAYYEIEHKNYRKSIQIINDATKYFELSGQKNPFLAANNEQLLGLSYYQLKDYKKSMGFYKQSLEKLNQMPDNFLKALVMNGMAQIYIDQKDPEKAKPLIEKAQKIAEDSPYLSLKREIYETSQHYYALTKDIDKIEESKQKQDSVIDKITSKSSAFINDSFTKLKKSNDENESRSNQKSLVIALALFILALTIVSFVFYRRNQKEKFRKIQQIVDEIEQTKSIVIQTEEQESFEINEITDKELVVSETANEAETESQALMTPATEKKILNKLEKFEQSVLFTRNNVSLPYVAAYCSTNTKYLSYVVNTYKKKDFKNYINELRVKHIIHKLKNDSQYHKYKISTLAEEAGFSSQSKFAAAFRKVTTISPSEFLEHLKSQNLN